MVTTGLSQHIWIQRDYNPNKAKNHSLQNQIQNTISI